MTPLRPVLRLDQQLVEELFLRVALRNAGHLEWVAHRSIDRDLTAFFREHYVLLHADKGPQPLELLLLIVQLGGLTLLRRVIEGLVQIFHRVHRLVAKVVAPVALNAASSTNGWLRVVWQALHVGLYQLRATTP